MGRPPVGGGSVDTDPADAQTAGNLVRVLIVGAPHAGGQPVGRVVRKGDCVGFAIERDDHDDRAEDLLARDSDRVVPDEHRGLDEETTIEPGGSLGPTSEELPPSSMPERM